MKKESKLFKLISFVLIFVLTIVSAFLGTQSFAKYLDEYNQTHGANVATPVVSIENTKIRNSRNYYTSLEKLAI